MLLASPFYKKVDNYSYFIRECLVFKQHLKGLIVLTSCLLVSACTETIIKEVTPGSTTETATTTEDSTTLGTGSNMVPISDTVTTVNTDTTSDTTNEMPVPAPVATSSPLLEDPSSEIIIGTPGTTVDCMNSLPCRWVSSDTQFALTITSADNIASRDRLSLSYVITTTHDSTIAISSAQEALTLEGLALTAEDQTLGEGNGGTPQGLLAGGQLMGMINFNDSASGAALSEWSISVQDSGIIRMATFSNIPLGSLTTTQADCSYTLPCIWSTADNDVAITLHSVGGISTNNRVSVNFSVETSAAMTIAIDQGSTASGSDGSLFEGRTLGLGFLTDYQKLSATIMARSPYFGSVHFYRTPSVPAYLHQLSLVLYQDEPVPRWNPQFINVPLQ
jgi:hypothetical protein